jgi:monoamine oxidase
VDELGLKLNNLGGENPGDEHTYFFNNERLGVDAKFIEQFRPVAKAIAADLKLMRVDGEISDQTAHAREVDRLSIPEWFEKRGISGLPTAVLRAAYVGEYGLEIDQQSALNLLLTMGDKTPPDEIAFSARAMSVFILPKAMTACPRGWRND